jgi:hypothetical protein
MVKEEPGGEKGRKKKEETRKISSGNNAIKSVIVKPVKRVSRKSEPRKKAVPKSKIS